MPLFLASALPWAKQNWKLALGGLVVAGLLIALLIAKADARHWHAKYDNAEAGRKNEEKAHAITRASLDEALAAIDDQNAAVQKLRTETGARLKASEAALEASRKAAERSDGIVRGLRASASEVRPGEPCKPSEAFWAARKEL